MAEIDPERLSPQLIGKEMSIWISSPEMLRLVISEKKALAKYGMEREIAFLQQRAGEKEIFKRKMRFLPMADAM